MAETFEEKMADWGNMSQEERDGMIEDIQSMCANFCGECPSYTGTGEHKLGFCVQGKSDVIEKDKGCLCPGCPITGKLSLRWDHFCLNGSSFEQAGID
jgi:hypothetical protein